ncbi:hypothetical protein [Limosilactobacillus difficilis]|uniref:hypothetical protein n=1 Tax=Limosilactobacillus difficilis TaxID=2991838 RepID=UPI0024BB5376|nr:hypothetical protein [Limosilactobacillus difficilis]
MIISVERILLDLQERVLALTDRVDDLSRQVDQLKAAAQKQAENQPEERKTTQRSPKIKGSLSKDQVVAAVKAALASKIPAQNIRKGKRSDGSGIVISKGSHKIKLCLRASGYYGQADVSSRMLYTGFSTLSKKAIESAGQLNYNFFVFAINTSDVPHQAKIEFFIFDQKEFKRLLQEKTPSGRNAMYYFYFGKTVDGHFIDDREKNRKVVIDRAHGNWDQLIQYYQQL